MTDLLAHLKAPFARAIRHSYLGTLVGDHEVRFVREGDNISILVENELGQPLLNAAQQQIVAKALAEVTNLDICLSQQPYSHHIRFSGGAEQLQKAIPSLRERINHRLQTIESDNAVVFEGMTPDRDLQPMREAALQAIYSLIATLSDHGMPLPIINEDIGISQNNWGVTIDIASNAKRPLLDGKTMDMLASILGELAGTTASLHRSGRSIQLRGSYEHLTDMIYSETLLEKTLLEHRSRAHQRI